MGEIVRQNKHQVTARELVLQSAAQANILPVISTCNVRCMFCSHGQNPPSAQTLGTPAVPVDLVNEALSLMDPKKPVVIGESVTRLMEGEPFIHPRFTDILKQIRKKLPAAEIKITTNGTLLCREMVDFLKSLGGVAICLSLNSSDTGMRGYLMNDTRAAVALAAPGLLREAGIPYQGSVVAMPHITGWKDLSGTLDFLDRHGASAVRVFMPGHTRFAPVELKVPPGLRDDLHAFIAGARKRLKVPVTMEPPVIESLDAEVAGVMEESPARKAGIRVGDIIAAVDGDAVMSRVEAFKRVLGAENPRLDLFRQGESISLRIIKERHRPSGLVFDYDIDPGTVREIVRAARRKRSGQAYVLTSVMGYRVVKMGIDKISDEGGHLTALAVKNRFFGGSIGCAGLLTVEDMLEVVKGISGKTDLVIVPAVAFDARGRDMAGKSFLDLNVKGGPLVVVL